MALGGTDLAHEATLHQLVGTRMSQAREQHKNYTTAVMGVASTLNTSGKNTVLTTASYVLLRLQHQQLPKIDVDWEPNGVDPAGKGQGDSTIVASSFRLYRRPECTVDRPVDGGMDAPSLLASRAQPSTFCRESHEAYYKHPQCLDVYSLLRLVSARSPSRTLKFSPTIDISATPPYTQRPSVRRRIKDAIYSLLCRPTRPPSPIQATSDLPSGAELLPDPPGLVKGDPVSESSAHERPGEPSAEGSSTKGHSPPEPLEEVDSSVQEGTNAALNPASIPSIPTHEEFIVGLPPSNPPTPQPYPAPAVGAQTPVNGTSADGDVQVHTPPSHPLNTCPADMHDHAFETTAEYLANPPSAASVAPATTVASIVLDEGDIESPLSIAEEQGPMSDGEIQGEQLYLTNVVITRNVALAEDTLPLRLTALCLLGVGPGSQEAEDFPLHETSPQRWTLNDCIALPLASCGLRCVVKDEEGHDIGLQVDLNQEDLQMSGDSIRQFSTYDLQLGLSMSWKIARNASHSFGSNLSQWHDSEDCSNDSEQESSDLEIDYYDDEGLRLARRFDSTGCLDDIDGSISAYEKAVEIARADSEGHVYLPVSLNNLGCSFQSRFTHTGNMSDITKAIATKQEALQLTSKGHSDQPAWLNNLGHSFQSRFDRTGDMPDITEAITLQREAIQLTPEGHADRPTWLNNLGNSYQSRFDRTGNISDITEAIASHQEAVRLTPRGHADLPTWLNNLGNSFSSRFGHTGNISDIAEAIASQQEAVRLTPKGHADRPVQLNNLGNSFSSRFDRTGDISDITKAIASQQEAIEHTPKGHANLPAWLNNLGNSFRSRYYHTGNLSDLTKAIASHQEAVQLTPQGHANLPARLNNLGCLFRSCFEHTGNISDIARAIASQQKAVQLTPEGHADWPARLNNLGNSFSSRFDRTGDMSDIADAIAAQQKAVQLTPKGHADRPTWLNNLGNSFHKRFNRSGDMSDITEAIAAKQEAVHLTPVGHAYRPSYLSNLGDSFQSRYNRTRNMSDIIDAIAFQQEAVQLAPKGHAYRPTWLNNLGASFQSRFDHTGDMSDVTEAIALKQEAVELTPEGHADRPTWLSNLGNSFQSRFDRTGNMPDINQAIAFQQEAVQLTPEGHAASPARLRNLGHSFLCRFVHANSMDDMHSSLRCFKAATECSTGAPRVRLQCALSWARLINCYNPNSLDSLVPFGFAIHFLTLVAGLERTLQSRHSQLQQVSGTVLEAAAAACRLGQPDKAVEWLEQGRCLVWGQLNGLRTPMDDLQQKDSPLAQRLIQVAGQLEFAGSTRAAIDPSMEISAKISLEEAARLHSALAKEWEELLAAARRLPGFETFLLPTPCAVLLEGLQDSGPIIIINPHRDRCDALALLRGSDKPLHIPLPDLSLEKAHQYRRVLKEGLHANGIRVRESTGSSDKELKEAQLQGRDMTQDWSDPNGTTAHDAAAASGVLRSLWLEVAKPILDKLGYCKYDPSTNSVPPRLCWCPTGVMSFLPIHAAGIFGGTDSECVMDYVVSSYTPTVTAITDRVKSSHLIDTTDSGLFLTSQPKAPGALEILGTTSEVNEIYAKAMERGVRTLRGEGDNVSIEDCRRYMGEFSSVHLACHASQNASDPLQSRFLLHKGKLTLLSIIQMNLKNADLAFLSACQTSTGEEKLSDEAVHLAAGMLAAGYRRVVATMWSINDGQAPKVATDFYEYLWGKQANEAGGGFDGSRSAHALHHAVQKLRRRLGNSERDLLTWIPYVHFGY